MKLFSHLTLTMETPSDSLDYNFCFPVPESLESDRVKLVPLVPSKHASILFEQLVIYPEMFTYLPFGPFKDLGEFKDVMLDGRFIKEHDLILFVVYDKTKPATAPGEDHPGTVAGMIGFLNSSSANLVTEIGAVMIFPPFQRTHVTSNAVGLLLQYCLNLPSQERVGEVSTESGLGLRRVCWQANALNKASVGAAERMGFRLEGILRWNRVLPANKDASVVGNGVRTRKGDPRCGFVGRDTAMLSFCWDDWEDGGREKVGRMMSRTA